MPIEPTLAYNIFNMIWDMSDVQSPPFYITCSFERRSFIESWEKARRDGSQAMASNLILGFIIFMAFIWFKHKMHQRAKGLKALSRLN